MKENNEIQELEIDLNEQITKFIGVLIGIVISIWILQICWNNFMPVYFNVSKISYWDSCLLYIISNILFKNSNYGF